MINRIIDYNEVEIDQISQRTSIRIDFLKTTLSPDAFGNTIKDANIATHNATQYISTKELESIAKKISIVYNCHKRSD